MMKGETGSLEERFLALENKMRALEEAGIGGAELRKVQDEVAVLILKNKKYFLGNVTVPEGFLDEEDLIQNLIVLFYKKYKARKGKLLPFLGYRLKYRNTDEIRKKHKQLPAKDQKEGRPSSQMRFISLEKYTRTFEDAKESSEYTIPDQRMDPEQIIVGADMSDEAFLELSAMVTRYIGDWGDWDNYDEYTGNELPGDNKSFLYYRASYTQGVYNYVKGEGVAEPPDFQHEADIIKATDKRFANFVTAGEPYSIDEPLTIRKIFFNELKKYKDVAPIYVQKKESKDVIAIPMKPFIIGGYMQRVYDIAPITASLVTQQMSKYEKAAMEALHHIGINSRRYKKEQEQGS